MHPLAEEYLKNKERTSAEPDEQEIRDFLIAEGLYEIQYSPLGIRDSEFPLLDSQNRAYRIVPISVTREEYEELRAASEKKTPDPSSGVQTAGIAVYVMGAIIGVLYFGSGLAPLVWLGTFISGTILQALSKIIAQLHQISKQEKQK